MKRNDNYCRYNSPFLSGKECYTWLNLQGASEEERREKAREQIANMENLLVGKMWFTGRAKNRRDG